MANLVWGRLSAKALSVPSAKRFAGCFRKSWRGSRFGRIGVNLMKALPKAFQTGLSRNIVGLTTGRGTEHTVALEVLVARGAKNAEFADAKCRQAFTYRGLFRASSFGCVGYWDAG